MKELHPRFGFYIGMDIPGGIIIPPGIAIPQSVLIRVYLWLILCVPASDGARQGHPGRQIHSTGHTHSTHRGPLASGFTAAATLSQQGRINIL